jgi:8-oxo-dGTP pyrophosphatase MutT (NUDIX family)
MKKRGFGAGKWNGFGGKVESGESFEEAAIRELHEECSIRCSNLSSIGYLVFRMEDDRKFMKVHVYETWEFEGMAIESDEMRPEWYHEHDIPFSKMWPDDEVSCCRYCTCAVTPLMAISYL